VPLDGAQNDFKIVPRSGAQNIPSIVSHIAGQLPWSHIKIILDKIKEPKEAVFYLTTTIKQGWGRDAPALNIYFPISLT
jgi:hypothetical protein